MRGLILWLRARPLLGDALLAAVVLAADLLALTASAPLLSVVIAVALAAPLVLRRRNPLLSGYLVFAGVAVQLAVLRPDAVLRPADVAAWIALYTVITFRGRGHGLLYSAVLVAALTAWALLVAGTPGVMLVYGLALAFVWALAEYSATRQAYLLEVESRLRRLESERDQQARVAVAAERTRIARELHDVVAHAVGVMVVQADGASYALRDHPQLAERALQTISETGRQSLQELRMLVAVLRNDEDPAALSPQPGVSALEELAATISRVGLPVTLDLRGPLDTLPTRVGLGVYRIVQEALTNALKYAGPEATAAVEVVLDGDVVRVSITDTGAVRAPLPPFPVPQPVDEPVEHWSLPEAENTSGHGLLGMRERAAVLGGTLHAGPRVGGGWQVRLALPMDG